MYKVLNVDELNLISKSWILDDKKIYNEDDIFSIDVDLILDNMLIEPNKIEFENIVNKKMFKEFTKKNLNKKHYVIIGIGKMNEIFVHTGNHRLAMLNGNNTTITKICCRLKYVEFPKKYKDVKVLPNGNPFIPYGLIPKWKQNEIQEG